MLTPTTTPPPDDDDLDDIDRDALVRAMKMAARDPSRGEQLRTMLTEGQSWIKVAKFAAGVCQRASLKLQVWQDPPSYRGGPDDPDADRLLQRLLGAGFSQWEPRPRVALAKAARSKK